MSTISATSYPFDPTGAKQTNKITGEQHILTAANLRDGYFLIPDVPPFTEASMSVTFKDAVTGVSRALTKNVDYYCSHLFLDASFSTAKPIFGSLTFLNTALVGVVTLAYNTIGGEWVPSNAQIAEAMANRLSNPRTTSWESIINLPNAFPVIDHEYNLVDLKGMDELVVSLDNLTKALAVKSGDDLAAHKAATGNVHSLTAEQLNAYTKPQADARINELIATALANHVAMYHS